MKHLKSGYLRLILVAICVVACLSACSKNPSAASNGTIKASIRLAWVPDMAEVGIFTAKQQGFYLREGIDLDIQPGGFGVDPFKLVAAGTNDFGVGGAGNLLLAREKGMPVVAVATEFQNTPVGFITRADSGIKDFSQFRGKRVGIQTGSDTDVLYRALLAKFKMTPQDVQEVPIQYEMTPFVSGQIDVLPGYVTNQPITLEQQGIKTTVITASSQGLQYYGNIYFVNEKTLTERQDLVKKFLRATLAGWEHAIQNKADAIAALKSFTKDFSDVDLDRIYDAVVPFIKPDEPSVPLLGMTQSRWESTYGALRDAQLSQQPKPLSEAFTQGLF